MRASIALGRACDGACVFCAQEGLARDASADAEVRGALATARANGSTEATFVGGEPASDERLEGFVAEARSLGFTRVGVQTNGRALSAPGRMAALARGGLTDVHLSIHGAEARVHDWHAGVAGAFDAAMHTMAAARAASLEVVVATVLTRSNFRVLAPLPRLLASRGVKAWLVEVPRWRGRAATAADRVVPRLALALPFALHALDVAATLGLPAFVRGAPSCLLGPFASRAVGSSPRAFAAACEGCSARPSCPGLDAEYLARFGGGELAPCAPVAVDAACAGAGTRASLRAAFVGVGELAPAIAHARAELPPERARVALPMLGRPAPAVAEVSASAPRQSGEALRAILPELFGDEAPKR